MRAFFIRVLFLLISANVAYGTSGDIYAEKVQALLDPAHALKFSYKPYINAELFLFSRDKATKAATEQSPGAPLKQAKAHAAWQFASPYTAAYRLSPVYQQHAASGISILAIRRLIFPRHSFL